MDIRWVRRRRDDLATNFAAARSVKNPTPGRGQASARASAVVLVDPDPVDLHP